MDTGKIWRYLTVTVLIAVFVAGGATQARPALSQSIAASSVSGRIAFTSNRDGNVEVYAMDTDGSKQTNLTNHPAWDGEPSWSPDGSKIAFVSSRDGNDEIYVMNAGGTEQTRLTYNVAADVWSPSWSPDGSKIAFASCCSDNSWIYVMNSNGTGQPTKLTSWQGGVFDLGTSWSPDGSKIAFVSSDGGPGGYEIYTVNIDGSGVTNLTNSPSLDCHPSWSPDGGKIAFASNRNGNTEIYIMNTDGSGVTNLTNSVWDVGPSWSPDGKKIAFWANRDGSSQVYVMNADGSGVTKLTISGTLNFHPSWGPGEVVIPTPTATSSPTPTLTPTPTQTPQLTPTPALACLAPSGLDVCALLPGDILLKRGSMDSQCRGARERERIERIGGTYFTHSALYVGNLVVAEAAGKADCDSLELCDRSDEVHEIALQLTQFWTGQCITDWAVVRPQASGAEKQIAINYAVAKAREEGVVFSITAPRDSENTFYCSKLVWRAYKEAGVEVEASSGLCTIDLAYFVTPDDLYFGSPTVQELLSPQMERLKAFVCSPAHLTLVDSGGRRTGFDPITGESLSEVPGAIYSGPDALVETVTIRELDGDSRLLVTGFDSGEYTLATEYVDNERPVVQSFTGVTYPSKEDWFIVSDPIPGVAALRLYLPFVMRGH